MPSFSYDVGNAQEAYGAGAFCGFTIFQDGDAMASDDWPQIVSAQVEAYFTDHHEEYATMPGSGGYEIVPFTIAPPETNTVNQRRGGVDSRMPNPFPAGFRFLYFTITLDDNTTLTRSNFSTNTN